MHGTRWTEDEGAVAVTVAITVLALLGSAMLAIDGGSLWASRRNLITDTDAAALAAARELVHGDCLAADITAAQDAAAEILLENDASSVLSAPATISCDTWAGRALVTAIRTTDLTFGGIAGIPEVDVASTSLAQYGQLGTGVGLRPMAICNKDPHVLEFARDHGYITSAEIQALLPGQDGIDLLATVDSVALDPNEHPTTGPGGVAYPAGSDVHRIYFSRAGTASYCGGSDGNWGWLDFDSGGGGANQVKDWIRNGYDQPITVGPPDECAPEVTTEDNCIGEPGAGGNTWDSALSDIQCPPADDEADCIGADKAFPIVLFDENVCTGPGTCGGSNARYDPDAFLGVILRDWSKVNGNPNDVSYFDFQFIDRFVTTGTVSGNPPSVGPGIVGIQLCGGGANALTDDHCTVTAP